MAVKESGREGKEEEEEEEGWETTVFSLRIERGSGVKKGLLRIEEEWRSNGHHERKDRERTANCNPWFENSPN